MAETTERSAGRAQRVTAWSAASVALVVCAGAVWLGRAELLQRYWSYRLSAARGGETWAVARAAASSAPDVARAWYLGRLRGRDGDRAAAELRRMGCALGDTVTARIRLHLDFRMRSSVGSGPHIRCDPRIVETFRGRISLRGHLRHDRRTGTLVVTDHRHIVDGMRELATTTAFGLDDFRDLERESYPRWFD